MKLLNFMRPWQIPVYGLLGSALSALDVIGEEGIDAYFLLVAGAWGIFVLPVNIVVLYPPLVILYLFVKSIRWRMILCGLCSILSFLAGLVSLTAIMSV